MLNLKNKTLKIDNIFTKFNIFFTIFFICIFPRFFFKPFIKVIKDSHIYKSYFINALNFLLSYDSILISVLSIILLIFKDIKYPKTIKLCLNIIYLIILLLFVFWIVFKLFSPLFTRS